MALARRSPTNSVGTRSAAAHRAVIFRTFSSVPLDDSQSLDGARAAILQSALEQVHQRGWTEEAISAAVMSSNLPLSTMGMVSPADLIAHFMDDCQARFQEELDTKYIPEWQTGQEEISDRLVTALTLRLKYVVPFCNSSKWHEGMALAAATNTAVTAAQLDRMVQSIADAIIVGTDHAPLGVMERTAIGAVYVSTELHLLADDSPNKEATWDFLKSRVKELEILAQSTSMDENTAVAASAVASSLGGAVVSLFQPAARGVISAVASTVVPQLATMFMQQSNNDGTRASDYNVPEPPACYSQE